MRSGRAIQLPFERCNELVVCRLVWPRHAEGRHRAGSQLPYHLLPHVGGFADAFDIHHVEHQPGRFDPLVVAADAIPVQECALGGNRGRRAVLRSPERRPAAAGRRRAEISRAEQGQREHGREKSAHQGLP
jgi:hypothetical protein